MPYERSTSTWGGGKRAETEVLRRYEAGQTKQQIMAETDIHAAVIDKAIGGLGDGELATRKRNHRAGSAALLAAVQAEAAERAKRRRSAQCTGTVANVLDHQGARDRLAFRIEQLLDVRPFASGRDACPRCAVRGDIGCKHQRAGQVAHG
jgi:hypothetical protein